MARALELVKALLKDLDLARLLAMGLGQVRVGSMVAGQAVEEASFALACPSVEPDNESCRDLRVQGPHWMAGATLRLKGPVALEH